MNRSDQFVQSHLNFLTFLEISNPRFSYGTLILNLDKMNEEMNEEMN